MLDTFPKFICMANFPSDLFEYNFPYSKSYKRSIITDECFSMESTQMYTIFADRNIVCENDESHFPSCYFHLHRNIMQRTQYHVTNFDTFSMYNFVAVLQKLNQFDEFWERGCDAHASHACGDSVSSIFIALCDFNARFWTLSQNSVEMKLNFIQNTRQCSWNTRSFQVVFNMQHGCHRKHGNWFVPVIHRLKTFPDGELNACYSGAILHRGSSTQSVCYWFY